MTMEEVTEMIRVHDIKKDNVIGFDEFKVIFSKDNNLTPLSLVRNDSLFRPMLDMTPSLPPISRSRAGSSNISDGMHAA